MINSLISVIIPIYNSSEFLGKCVTSVINQTYKNLEIILVDDGSTDDSSEMCYKLAELDNRIKVINKTNGGVSSARNTGLKNATGEFVAFVDSDDFLDEDYLYSMITRLKKDTELVVAGFTIIDGKKKRESPLLHDTNLSPILENLDTFMKFETDGLLDVPYNKLYKRELITHGFSEGLKLGEDRIFNLNYLRGVKGKIVGVNSFGYNYVLNSGSAVHKKRTDIFEILVVSVGELKSFLIEKFGEFKCNEYFIFVETFIYSCLKRISREGKKGLKQKIYSSPLVEDYLKFYKPSDIKNKIKFWLIKHKLLGLFNLLTK